MIRRLMLGAAVMLCAAQAVAGEVTVTGASVRATAPGQDSAAVSMRITARKDARLIAVSSPAAERVEIHIMKHENGMMKMREVDELALPASQEVVLGAGSHLMLVGLKQPLKAGGRVPLTLTVEYSADHRETVSTLADVRPSGGAHDMHDMHDMHDHDE